MFGAGENGGQAPSRWFGRKTVVLATGITALVVVAGGLTWAFASGHGSSPASAAVSTQNGKPAPAAPAAPLHVLSVTPGQAARGVNGAAPVTVVFSAPLATTSPTPTFSPAVQGTWAPAKTQSQPKTSKSKAAKTPQAYSMVFTPATQFRPHSTVTLKIPAGQTGVRSAAGGVLGSPVTERFHTGSYSTMRLQQLLAQLGYLPLTWTPSGANPAATDSNAQLSAAYQPPAGTFTWQSGYPSRLQGMWQPGADNLIQVGAVRAFESVEGLTMDGVAGPAVWRDLLRAAADGRQNPNGYTYAIASKASPETLTIWHDGRMVLRTDANTGIPAAPTVDGTFPVYERLPFQIMKGTNPDGSKYADPVQNVSYFNGGDAVHYFPRSSFGWPQSLGCVELPLAQSATAYHYLTYGSLVTVAAA
ncbi:MAG TPA: L,D-transpeptidase family protein [Streptosporangiaceae bacterium]